MKKNIFIIVLSVLVLTMAGYLVYDKIFYQDNKVKNNPNQTPNNYIESEQDKLANQNKSIEEKAEDIAKQIETTKTDQKLNDVEKAEKIATLIYSDYNKILDYSINYECNKDKELNSYICEGKDQYNNESKQHFNFDTDITVLAAYPAMVKLDLTASENYTKLNEYLNFLEYDAYKIQFEKKNNITINYDEKLYSTFSLTAENACIGYTNERNYIYININKVNGNKLGWYMFNKFTGECSNLVKTIAQYKIDKQTYTYELIEK